MAAAILWAMGRHTCSTRVLQRVSAVGLLIASSCGGHGDASTGGSIVPMQHDVAMDASHSGTPDAGVRMLDPQKPLCKLIGDGGRGTTCNCTPGAYPDQEGVDCNSTSLDGAICQLDAMKKMCTCKRYGCTSSEDFLGNNKVRVALCSCDTLQPELNALSGHIKSAGCAFPFVNYCLDIKKQRCEGHDSAGCDAAAGEIQVPSCDTAEIVPMIASAAGNVSDCAAAVVGSGGLGTEVTEGGACQGQSRDCKTHADCCGHDTGAATCHKETAPNGVVSHVCRNTCQTKADCNALCCVEFEPGEKACEVCPPVCSDGDSRVHKPTYAGTGCQPCLEQKCCPQLKACDLACFQCALHDQTCAGNATFAAVTSCMKTSCAVECKESACNDGNCTGCDYPGGGSVCCNKCVGDVCKYECTF